MQVARLIEPRDDRNLSAKLRQIARAWQIERPRRQGRRARPLSDAGAVRRQSRGRARRLARLFRQGAAQADDRRGGAAGRAAAVAGDAPAGHASPTRRAPRRARVLDRVAARGVISRDEAEAAQARADPATRASALPMLAAHAAEEAVAADPNARVIKLSIDARLQAKLEALARERGDAARPETVGGDRRHRQCQRRSPRPRRRRRLSRRRARRRARHVARAALARLGAEAVHLRARLRAGARPSRDGAVRPAGALRRLCAAEFRPRLSGHGDGAQGAADVAQPAGDRAARRRRPGDASSPGCTAPARRSRCRRTRRSAWRSASAASAFR